MKPLNPQARLRWPVLGFLGISLLWLLINLLTLTRYPHITCDEAFYGRTSSYFMQGLLTGETWPQVGINFHLLYGRLYWFLMGLSFKLLGVNIVAARLVSLVGWIIFVTATYDL